MNRAITGLLLAGGQSSRMGFDKRSLQLNGQSLVEHFFDLLKPHCDQVYTCCKKEAPVGEHLNPVFDRYDFGGPLNGILSAMEELPGTNFLILAIDQPFITSEHLHLLCASARPEDQVVAFRNTERNGAEPFPSLWKKSSLSDLQDFLKINRPSPLDFINHTRANLINSPDNRFLVNLNRPEDLKEIEGLQRGMESANS